MDAGQKIKAKIIALLLISSGKLCEAWRGQDQPKVTELAGAVAVILSPRVRKAVP